MPDLFAVAAFLSSYVVFFSGRGGGRCRGKGEVMGSVQLRRQKQQLLFTNQHTHNTQGQGSRQAGSGSGMVTKPEQPWLGSVGGVSEFTGGRTTPRPTHLSSPAQISRRYQMQSGLVGWLGLCVGGGGSASVYHPFCRGEKVCLPALREHEGENCCVAEFRPLRRMFALGQKSVSH